MLAPRAAQIEAGLAAAELASNVSRVLGGESAGALTVDHSTLTDLRAALRGNAPPE
jgi:hypothetical protein